MQLRACKIKPAKEKRMSALEKLLRMGKTMRLLYVEDDEPLQSELALMLSDFFDTIVLASDGEEGLEKFLQEPFELVITDIKMPKMDGIEMIRAIKKTHPSQPIIVTSAYNEAEYLLQLIDLGVDGFITKSLSSEHIFHTLAKNVERIHASRELGRYQKKLEELNAALEEEVLTKAKALKQSYVKALAYQKAFETVGTLLLLDGEGRVIQASTNALGLFGFPKEEFEGMPYKSLLDASAVNKEAFLHALSQKIPWQGELAFQTKAMRQLYAYVNCVPVALEGQALEFLVVMQDQSLLREKQEEEKIHAHACKLTFTCKHLVEHLPLPAAILDEKGCIGLHNFEFVEMVEEGSGEGLMYQLKEGTLRLERMLKTDDPFLEMPSLWEGKARGFVVLATYETVLESVDVRVHIKRLDKEAGTFLAVLCHQGVQDDAL